MDSRPSYDRAISAPIHPMAVSWTIAGSLTVSGEPLPAATMAIVPELLDIILPKSLPSSLLSLVFPKSGSLRVIDRERLFVPCTEEGYAYETYLSFIALHLNGNEIFIDPTQLVVIGDELRDDFGTLET